MYFIGSDSDILAWLFADTPKGAFANGVLYTLVESARANELDVYEYLKYLLTEMPNNHHLEDPSVIDSLLPWSKELPEQCHLKRNRKSASNIDVGIIVGTLLVYTTPCFEALTQNRLQMPDFQYFLFLISPKICLGEIFLEVPYFFSIFRAFSIRMIHLSNTLLWKFTL